MTDFVSKNSDNFVGRKVVYKRIEKNYFFIFTETTKKSICFSRTFRAIHHKYIVKRKSGFKAHFLNCIAQFAIFERC